MPMKKNKSKPVELPLPEALRAFLSAKAEIAECLSLAEEYEAEVREGMKRIDVRDEKAAKIYDSRRLMAEMARNQAKNVQEKLDELITAVARACDTFQDELLRKAKAESEELLVKIADLVRPYCRDFDSAGSRQDAARLVAGQCTVFAVAFLPHGRVGGLSLPSMSRGADPAKHDAEVVSRAEELLAFAAGLEKAGSFAAKFAAGATE
jgi:hypothetical protein